jgi:hypothetical protein
MHGTTNVKVKIYIKVSYIRPCMFRFTWTILGELTLYAFVEIKSKNTWL